MSRIWFRISGNEIVFGKGEQAKFSIGPKPDTGPRKIYHIGDEEAAQITIGAIITYKGITGVIQSLPTYRKFKNYGFWYADVLWQDGKMENFNLNRMGVAISCTPVDDISI
jgi:hypothetical protein